MLRVNQNERGGRACTLGVGSLTGGLMGIRGLGNLPFIATSISCVVNICNTVTQKKHFSDGSLRCHHFTNVTPCRYRLSLS